MEARLTKVTRRLRAGLLLACVLSGCKSMEWRKNSEDGPPRTGTTSQVVATWSNKVHYVPDVMAQGTPMPGIAGRVYLFGPQVDFPQAADGKFIVELVDDSGPTPGGVPVEQWAIDCDTAKNMLSKDLIGWGYTMFLPWGTYKPDMTKVHMTIRYEPAKGQPVYALGGPLTLEHTTPSASQVQQAGYRK